MPRGDSPGVVVADMVVNEASAAVVVGEIQVPRTVNEMQFPFLDASQLNLIM